VWTGDNGVLKNPAGVPEKLFGYRLMVNGYGNRPSNPASVSVWRRAPTVAELAEYQSDGILGNMIAPEIWFSHQDDGNPGEPSPLRPGVYNEDAMDNLLATLRDFAQKGVWIVPSFRVSYDQEKAIAATAAGTAPSGWADHNAVILNEPVVTKDAGQTVTRGRHRDRFFAWLDWIVPKLMSDPVVSEKIAYWEMWHFAGHRCKVFGANVQETYLGDFQKDLVALFRKHDPNRLLGVSIRMNSFMQRIIAKREADPSWQPVWSNDPNWILITGGYGDNGVTMRPDYNGWVEGMDFHSSDSSSPKWLGASKGHDVKYLRTIWPEVTMHSQEGPGLRDCYRCSPIPKTQKWWNLHLMNLYRDYSNGFGTHAWPPYWGRTDYTGDDAAFNAGAIPGTTYDETHWQAMVAQAFADMEVTNPGGAAE
jgi:hypothetical protein